MQAFDLHIANPKHISALSMLKNHMLLARMSKNTTKRYVAFIRKIILEFNRLPEECSKSELIDYLMRHKTLKGYQYSTIRNIVYALRYYLIHIAENEELSIKIPIPKVKTYDIEVLSTSEIQLLLEACTNSKQRLILQILYETGIRCSELEKLSIDNIDFNLNVISIINSKNNKTRTIKFGATLAKAIQTYIKEFPSLFPNTLFASAYYPLLPISSSSIYHNLQYASRKTNISKKISPHIIRHTFDVHYLNFGGSIFQLQNILGHSNMVTTLNYLQYAILPESKNISMLDTLKQLDK